MPDPNAQRHYLWISPADIDGDPHEVATESLKQLQASASWLASLADLTEVQVRNAFQTMVLNEAPATTPEELSLRWEESDQKAGIDRVGSLAAATAIATQKMR